MELIERQRVVAESKKWIGTKYHLNAKIRGVGVDCGTFLIACFESAGLISGTDLGTFKPDFNLHRNDEVYANWLERFCVKVDRNPLPGDIILYRFGRIGAHGAIVVDWPTIIHAAADSGVMESNASDPAMLSRQMAVYSFWGKK